MNEKVQEFLGEALLNHARTHGFAFLLEERKLIEECRERFELTRSQALWELTLFIQENGGPEGDLAVIDREDGRFFQWRFVEWPSWLPDYIRKPRWHRKDKHQIIDI